MSIENRTSCRDSLPFRLIAWSLAIGPFPAWAATPPMVRTAGVFLHPFDAVFERVSGFTSNSSRGLEHGFGSATIDRGTERAWTARAPFIVSLGMLTGAAAGSTASGPKLIRVITLVEEISWQARDVFSKAHPWPSSRSVAW